MKYFLFILIFYITSCSPPEPGTEAWFKEKHKELKAVDPEVEITLEEFKEMLLSPPSEEASDNKIMEKHSIAFWLMDDSLLQTSEDTNDDAQMYIRTLKLCSANFAVMNDNMEAGLMYGKTITGLDDADEISRLSDEYKNHHVILTGAERMKRSELFNMINEIMNNSIDIDYKNEGVMNHYKFTPYSFDPSVSKKLIANPHIDMGQGILACIRAVHNNEK